MDKALFELDNVLSAKCPLHPTFQCDFLHVAASAAHYRACICCLIDGDVPFSAAVCIKSLF